MCCDSLRARRFIPGSKVLKQLKIVRRGVQYSIRIVRATVPGFVPLFYGWFLNLLLRKTFVFPSPHQHVAVHSLLGDALAKDSFANLPVPRGVEIRLVDAYTMDKDFVHPDRHVS